MSRTFFRKRQGGDGRDGARPSQGGSGHAGRVPLPGESLTENAVIGSEGNALEEARGGRAVGSLGAHRSVQTDRQTYHSGGGVERHARSQTDRTETDTSGGGVERHATIFDDTDVCRILGLRRRELVKARASGERGTDWDVVGTHAGMTARWIRRWNANARIEGLKPVDPGDGIVTVRIVGRVQNGDMARAVRVADGTVVTVRGIANAWYLHIGDEMDTMMIGGGLMFVQALNTEAY